MGSLLVRSGMTTHPPRIGRLEGMPRNTPAVEKRPNIFKQVAQLLRFTRDVFPWAPWAVLAASLLGVAIGLLAAFLIPGNLFTRIAWILTGILGGILLGMVTLSQLAQRAMYKKLDGTPGAVGHVLSTGLGRSWQASDTPVGVNPKTQDAVYRAIGKGGIVIVGEGSPLRLKKLVADEEKRDKRIASGVPITVFYVGHGPDEVPLDKLTKTIKKLPKAIDKGTQAAVIKRAASVNAGGVSSLPIPKGIDPTKVRAPRPR